MESSEGFSQAVKHAIFLTLFLSTPLRRFKPTNDICCMIESDGVYSRSVGRTDLPGIKSHAK